MPSLGDVEWRYCAHKKFVATASSASQVVRKQSHVSTVVFVWRAGI